VHREDHSAAHTREIAKLAEVVPSEELRSFLLPLCTKIAPGKYNQVGVAPIPTRCCDPLRPHPLWDRVRILSEGTYGNPNTWTGVEESVVVPSPSSPQ
jgi:hypothetical protein